MAKKVGKRLAPKVVVKKDLSPIEKIKLQAVRHKQDDCKFSSEVYIRTEDVRNISLENKEKCKDDAEKEALNRLIKKSGAICGLLCFWYDYGDICTLLDVAER